MLPSHTSTATQAAVQPFHGYVDTTEDALRLIEVCGTECRTSHTKFADLVRAHRTSSELNTARFGMTCADAVSYKSEPRQRDGASCHESLDASTSWNDDL